MDQNNEFCKKQEFDTLQKCPICNLFFNFFFLSYKKVHFFFSRTCFLKFIQDQIETLFFSSINYDLDFKFWTRIFLFIFVAECLCLYDALDIRFWNDTGTGLGWVGLLHATGKLVLLAELEILSRLINSDFCRCSTFYWDAWRVNHLRSLDKFIEEGHKRFYDLPLAGRPSCQDRLECLALQLWRI